MLHTTGLVDGLPMTRLLMLFDDEESDDHPDYDNPEEQLLSCSETRFIADQAYLPE